MDLPAGGSMSVARHRPAPRAQDVTARDGAAITLQGRYALGRVLGSGGEASVYAARDLLLDRDVAVKVFHRRVAPPSAGRVQQMEARVAAALNHYALTTLIDSGVDVGPDGAAQLYLVMEYVPGETLSKRLRRGALEIAQACWMGFDLAEGLDYMHQTGFLHRDVKPSNVLISGLRSVRPVVAKLTDFGIAAPVGQPDLSEYTVGTAAYLSPEQVEGRDAEPASDVYSLGLVLLEAMTGRVEFPGSVTKSAFERLVRDPRIGSEIPPRTATLLRRMTARDPAQRISLYDTAVELQQILVDDLVRRRDDATGPAPAPAPAPAAASDVPAITEQEHREYDAVLHLAAQACGAPMSVLLIGGEHDRSIAAAHGWDQRPFELAARPLTAAPTAASADAWTQSDLLGDPRTSDHPLTRAPYHVRAAAAVTVRTEGDRALGTLFAFDTRPRAFSGSDLQSLHRAATLIESNLHLRAAIRRILYPE